jgi:hypothetical protein
VIRAERNTIRFGLPGILFAAFFYFKTFQDFIEKISLYKIIELIVIALVIYLTAIRSVLIWLLIFSLYNMLFHYKGKFKIQAILVFILIFGLIIYFNYDIFNSIFNVTSNLIKNWNNDIRISSAEYYGINMAKSNLGRILGNSASYSLSPYGQMMERLQNLVGLYQGDIGIIGAYSMYGILFILTIYLILLKAIRIKVNPSNQYLKYLLIAGALVPFLGDFYTKYDSITFLVINLYLLDYYKIRGTVEK